MAAASLLVERCQQQEADWRYRQASPHRGGPGARPERRDRGPRRHSAPPAGAGRPAVAADGPRQRLAPGPASGPQGADLRARRERPPASPRRGQARPWPSMCSAWPPSSAWGGPRSTCPPARRAPAKRPRGPPGPRDPRTDRPSRAVQDRGPGRGRRDRPRRQRARPRDETRPDGSPDPPLQGGRPARDGQGPGGARAAAGTSRRGGPESGRNCTRGHADRAANTRGHADHTAETGHGSCPGRNARRPRGPGNAPAGGRIHSPSSRPSRCWTLPSSPPPAPDPVFAEEVRRVFPKERSAPGPGPTATGARPAGRPTKISAAEPRSSPSRRSLRSMSRCAPGWPTRASAVRSVRRGRGRGLESITIDRTTAAERATRTSVRALPTARSGICRRTGPSEPRDVLPGDGTVRGVRKEANGILRGG